MQKVAFMIALVVLATAAAILCGIHGSNPEAERQGGDFAGAGLKLSAPVAWDSGTEFWMHWNDVTKKLVFDGPFCRCAGSPRRDGLWHFESHPQEFSFDAGDAFEFDTPSDPSRQDNRVHYPLRWDDTKNSFVFEGRPIAPERHFCDGRDINSFNHNLDIPNYRLLQRYIER